jgi:hypothetical protein
MPMTRAATAAAERERRAAEAEARDVTATSGGSDTSPEERSGTGSASPEQESEDAETDNGDEIFLQGFARDTTPLPENTSGRRRGGMTIGHRPSNPSNTDDLQEWIRRQDTLSYGQPSGPEDLQEMISRQNNPRYFHTMSPDMPLASRALTVDGNGRHVQPNSNDGRPTPGDATASTHGTVAQATGPRRSLRLARPSFHRTTSNLRFRVLQAPSMSSSPTITRNGLHNAITLPTNTSSPSTSKQRAATQTQPPLPVLTSTMRATLLVMRERTQQRYTRLINPIRRPWQPRFRIEVRGIDADSEPTLRRFLTALHRYDRPSYDRILRERRLNVGEAARNYANLMYARGMQRALSRLPLGAITAYEEAVSLRYGALETSLFGYDTRGHELGGSVFR